MGQKFTYFDFMMYLLPGSFFVIACLIGIWIIAPGTCSFVKADIFSSIIFLLISFMLGNLIQAHAHGRPEDRLKRAFWDGLYPSERMFFASNSVLNERARNDLLRCCAQRGLLSEADFALFSTPKNLSKEAISKASNVFSYLRTYLENTDKNERIRGAEAYYQFFRGMFVASFWAAIIFIALVLLHLSRIEWSSINRCLGPKPNDLRGLFLPVLLSLAYIYAWRVFRSRCRGTAQGYARIVQRSFCSSQLFSPGGQG